MIIDLHEAAAHGDIEKIKLFLAQGADIESRDLTKRTPLHSASQNNKPRAVEALLIEGANIEAKSYCGETPLHLAAGTNSRKATTVLLTNGANIEARCWGVFNNTALHLAAHNASRTGNTGALELLLINDANQTVINEKSFQPVCRTHLSAEHYPTVPVFTSFIDLLNFSETGEIAAHVKFTNAMAAQQRFRELQVVEPCETDEERLSFRFKLGFCLLHDRSWFANRGIAWWLIFTINQWRRIKLPSGRGIVRPMDG